MIKRVLAFDSSFQKSVLADFISKNKVKILRKLKTCQNCFYQKFPYKTNKHIFLKFFEFLCCY